MAKAIVPDIRNRVTEYRLVRAGDILPNPKNWRAHPDNQRAAYRAITEDIGFAGALLTKDEARKTQRLFFSQLGGDRLMLVRRLRKRSSRSRGVLKRRYKGREAGTPLKPREVVEVVYVFSKDIKVKGRWPFPAIVEKAVADHWDAEMWYALQRALDEAD